MGIRVEYDSLHKIVQISIDGVITDYLAREVYCDFRRVRDSYHVVCAIADCTGVNEVQLSIHTIRWLAEFKPPIFPLDMTRVIIAEKDVVFGVSRMYQEIALRNRKNLFVVHTMKEALNVIGVESPKFSSITVDKAA
jgi:hypothetical protein